jgi:cytochrome c biogenesis protein CcmG/thiol:disulfide interchange protein DsbE
MAEKLSEPLPFESTPAEAPARRGLSPASVVLLTGILAVVIVIGIQLSRQNAGPIRPGQVAPDFALDLYGGGERFSLADQRGEIVVLNFWGSWCLPCRDEAPHLEAIHQRYADQGVKVVGVGFRDTEGDALQFIAEHDITYPNGPDMRFRITDAYFIRAVPETFIIAPDGTVSAAFYGPVTEAELDAAIGGLLSSVGGES